MADATMPLTPAPVAVNPNAKSGLLLVTYLIPIVFIYTMMKNSDKPFFVFHSKNAAGYLAFAILLNLLIQIIASVLPSLFVTLGSLIGLVNLLVWLVYIYFGAFMAWKGEQKSVPLITWIGSKLPIEKWFGKKEAAMATPQGSTPASSAQVAPAAPTEPSVPTEPAAPVAPAPVEPAAPAIPSAGSEPTPPTPPQA